MISERHLLRIKSYCCGDFTSIENYSDAIADKTQKWHCHHRKELTEDGDFAYSMEDLIKMGEYYNRPSEELILLTESEHQKLHGKGRSDEYREKISKSKKGRKYTAEHCDNISKAQKGDKSPFYGKTWKVINGKRVWLSKEVVK